ncbi:MAG TPA: helix-turn-helix domain-containing protein [Allosphingosinicella sp.]|nr:helix-turn-helix domain-containing protein [Allosphingosinicella sp.]
MDSPRPSRTDLHDDGVDRWAMVRAAPGSGLAGRVRSYCAYWEETASFAARRELAGTNAVLIYALGEPLEITGADGRAIVLRAGEGFAAGIADGTSISRGLGPQAGLQVDLPLESLAALLGAPVAALANRAVALDDLLGAEAAALGDALCHARGDEARFALVDAFLARRFARERETDRAATWAARRLLGEEAPSSSALAAELGWSRKQLARRVGAVTGFGPDRLRRLARFERFAESIGRRPDESLAGLAAAHGYADQAHLTHEVRAFSGMTPGELRARQLPGQGGVRED